MEITRRGLLAGAAVLGAGVLLPAGPAYAAGEYDTLRQRWRDLLTGGDIDTGDPDFAAALRRLDETADAHAALLDGSDTRAGVFTDLPLNDSARMGITYTRLRDLTYAWATPGTRRHGDTGTLAAILDGLDFANQRIYYAGKQTFGNWWFWEIGVPQALGDTCVLLHPHLPGEALTRYLAAIDYFVPDPTRFLGGRYVSTGANRTDLCLVAALSGILGQRAERLVQGRDGLSGVFGYVTSGDGYYVDGSFVQHNVIAYTGTYGSVLLSGVARLVQLLAGSSWAVTDPKRAVVFDAVERTYAPILHDGRDLDFVRGRAVSRERASDHVDGHSMIEAILRLAAGAPAADAALWRARAKGWWSRDTYHPVLRHGTVARIATAKRLLGDAGVATAKEPVEHRQFPGMNRVVHRRPNWAYGISLASSRIAYFEAGNGENPRGWYTGCGMTYLYDGDGGQFADAYWPTVDAMRLPGVTVDRKPLAPNTGTGVRPPVSFVGGAVLAEPGAAAAGPMVGQYGAVAAQIAPPSSPLRGVKAWFCLDDLVVALGAGFTGSSGHPVETVVENRNLGESGRHTLTVDGAAQPSQPGWSGNFTDAGWAHLDGVAGYVFPAAGNLRALREARTGAWRDINPIGDTAGSPTPRTRRYATLWFDHGVDPSGASYAYCLLPGASLAQTAAYAAAPDAEIIANTAALQAIRVSRLGLTAAVFHQAGTAGGITASGRCVVLLAEQSGEATVAVSDPSRASSPVTVELRLHGYGAVAGADPEVTVLRLSPTPQLRYDLTAARGGTRVARLTH